MRLNNINFNIKSFNFAKTLRGVGAIKSEFGQEEVRIYHLDEVQDKKDLLKARKSPIWKGSYYLDDTAVFADSYIKNYSVYSMENSSGDLLCYSVVDNNRSKESRLRLIETAPKYSCYNRLQRNAKYIGETMMAFIAAQSGKKKFTIAEVANRQTTKDFYYKGCKFIPHKIHGAILPDCNLRKLIDKNANHTGKKIEVIF